MTRKVYSALVGVGMCVGLTAFGQEPPAQKPDDKPKPPAPVFVELAFPGVSAPDGLEAAIAAALRQHPDVRLAEAKRQVADAELAQAKLLVTQRLTATHGKVADAKAQVKLRELEHNRIKQLAGKGVVTQDEAGRVEAGLAAAKANLAAAEADFRAAVGAVEPAANAATRQGMIWLGRNQAPGVVDYELTLDGRTGTKWLVPHAVIDARPAPGTPAEKLRGLVDRTVKLDQKPLPFSEAVAEFIPAAGLGGLAIRYPEWATAKHFREPPAVGALRGEQTVVAWVQMMLDDFNRAIAEGDGVPQDLRGKYEAYVREYGLLVTKADLAPPGAVTLSEFARQVRAEEAAAEKAKPSQGAGKE